MNSGLNLSTIRDSKDFHSLRDEWNELLKLSKSDTIFLRWEWLYNWWLVYGRGTNQLYIIIVREGSRLLGVAPLYIKKRYLNFSRIISFLGSNIVCSDYLDFILIKNREREVGYLILSYLNENSRLWDIIELTDLPSESTSLPLIKSFFQDYRIIIKREYTICPYINLNSTLWDSIYNSYAPILRNTIKRKNKKFEALPNSGFREVTSYDDLDRYISEFLRLSRLRFEMKKIRSPFLDADFLTFHQNVINSLYKMGMANLYFLEAGGELIAGIYILLYDGKYYYYQSGFDPDWQKLSPGTLLFHHCIKIAFINGAKEFDFLQGDEAYKSDWTKEKKINVKATIYNRKAKGRLLCIIDEGIMKLKDIVKKFQSIIKKND
jgi:CelD/BcsL family acetyltransferase involved in cellulose biosynthesis